MNRTTWCAVRLIAWLASLKSIDNLSNPSIFIFPSRVCSDNNTGLLFVIESYFPNRFNVFSLRDGSYSRNEVRQEWLGPAHACKEE